MLRDELKAIETSFLQAASSQPSDAGPGLRLDGRTLLYVGGRPHQIVHIRAVIERLGGRAAPSRRRRRESPELAARLGEPGRLVCFPVDCVSHDAAHAVKSPCRQGGQRFVPLRSAGLSSLLTAIRRLDVAGLADVAD